MAGPGAGGFLIDLTAPGRRRRRLVLPRRCHQPHPGRAVVPPSPPPPRRPDTGRAPLPARRLARDDGQLLLFRRGRPGRLFASRSLACRPPVGLPSASVRGRSARRRRGPESVHEVRGSAAGRTRREPLPARRGIALAAGRPGRFAARGAEASPVRGDDLRHHLNFVMGRDHRRDAGRASRVLGRSTKCAAAGSAVGGFWYVAGLRPTLWWPRSAGTVCLWLLPSPLPAIRNLELDLAPSISWATSTPATTGRSEAVDHWWSSMSSCGDPLLSSPETTPRLRCRDRRAIPVTVIFGFSLTSSPNVFSPASRGLLQASITRPTRPQLALQDIHSMRRPPRGLPSRGSVGLTRGAYPLGVLTRRGRRQWASLTFVPAESA